ncbi:MAG: glycosyltransferase family 2 protein [Thermoflexales bacterium]|nr:glycosyltransferase family 2 protein [Thermoflexales bacterium]
MINKRRLAVVMPAYNAAKTLKRVMDELPHEIVDDIILVDDASRDNTSEVARDLKIGAVVRHNRNLGYGGNQKTCYTLALERGADIVVMVHPDAQYSPRLVGAIAWMIGSGEYDVVLASRILGNRTLDGGMPIWKYLSNRFLTAFENLLLGIKLSEYHTGYRAFTRTVLETLPLNENSDDFVFDNEMIAQAANLKFKIGEISCPTVYDDESSSISFKRSVKYGFGVLRVSLVYRLNKLGLRKDAFLSPEGRRLELGSSDKRGARVA